MKIPLLFSIFLITLVGRCSTYLAGFMVGYQIISLTLSLGTLIFYLHQTKRINVYQFVITIMYVCSEAIEALYEDRYAVLLMGLKSLSYLSLFYFLYQNHKSFNYNIRDIKILWGNSLLYTIIFIGTIYTFQEIPGINFWSTLINLSLLYVLLIITGMHYINIRSVKSLYFFLAVLYFTITDFTYILYYFYLNIIELRVISIFCGSFGFLLLINYFISKYTILKAEEFEGF